MKLSGQKVLIYFSILMVAFLLLFLFRHNILLGVGSLLIQEDSPAEVDAIFVLSGAPEERAKAAAALYRQDYSKNIIATGSLIPPILDVLDTTLTEAELTRAALLKEGVDTLAIEVMNQGTSTFEESDIILGYAQSRNYRRIIIVSSKFHTRRIQRVFRNKFDQAGLTIFVVGADPDPERYKIGNWWNSEEGLIFVNNEYMKHLYYLWKYR